MGVCWGHESSRELKVLASRAPPPFIYIHIDGVSSARLLEKLSFQVEEWKRTFVQRLYIILKYRDEAATSKADGSTLLVDRMPAFMSASLHVHGVGKVGCGSWLAPALFRGLDATRVAQLSI